MSRGKQYRQAQQELTCRAALARHLQGDALEKALFDLRDAMRRGPQAWAFKAAGVAAPDETIYYETGGAA